MRDYYILVHQGWQNSYRYQTIQRQATASNIFDSDQSQEDYERKR